jgi:hypothetical protein
VIVGYQDSTAHDYAIAHNRTFIPFESDCLMKKKISIQVDEKTSSEEIGMTDDEIFQKLENYSVLDGSIVTVNEEGTICGVTLGKTKIILMNEEKTALKIFEVEVIGKEPEKDTTTTSETTTKEETVAEDTSKARSTKKPTVLKSSKILKIKAKKKSLKICWKKVAGIGGYQLQYSKNKNFKKKKTITIRTGTRTSQTIKRLNSKKIYYVRICTYQKIGKKILKSAWSKVRQKKTK